VNNNRNTSDVDELLFDITHETNDIFLQINVLESLLFRIRRFEYSIDISKFSAFIEKSLERIYKYKACIVVFKESYDPVKEDEGYEKRFYPLLMDELEFRARLLLENIFRAFRIAYPDDPAKKFFFKKYYFDLLSTDRVRKDNATTVLEQILPKHLYLEMYNLFTIEDFENKNRDKDFKETVQKRYSGFDLKEEEILKFLIKEGDPWLKILIDYGRKEGGKDMGKDTLDPMDRVNFLKKTEVFKEVPAEILFLLAAKATDKIYQSGEYILENRAVVDSLFVIYKGDVEVLVGKEEKSVAILGEKEVLGEMELFRDIQQRYAVASVRAKSDEVVCIRIRKNNFDEVLETNIELARALIVSLGKRLERMNERVREMERRP